MAKRVATLETENNNLEKEVAAMQDRMDALDDATKDSTTSSKKSGAKKSDVEKAGAVTIAGLLAALIALAVAATACCRVNKLVSNRSSMETAQSCVPTSGRKESLGVQGDTYTPSTNGVH